VIRQTDIKALVPLLEQDWESPEALAKALIGELDKARAERGFHVGVLQFGERIPIYVGLGPYAGIKSAERAVAAHPSAAMAVGVAVVPVTTPAAMTKLLSELDAAPPKPKPKPTKRGNR
jgi:hypothetical protein